MGVVAVHHKITIFYFYDILKVIAIINGSAWAAAPKLMSSFKISSFIFVVNNHWLSVLLQQNTKMSLFYDNLPLIIKHKLPN